MACGNYVYNLYTYEISFPFQIEKKTEIKPIATEVFAVF